MGSISISSITARLNPAQLAQDAIPIALRAGTAGVIGIGTATVGYKLASSAVGTGTDHIANPVARKHRRTMNGVPVIIGASAIGGAGLYGGFKYARGQAAPFVQEQTNAVTGIMEKVLIPRTHGFKVGAFAIAGAGVGAAYGSALSLGFGGSIATGGFKALAWAMKHGLAIITPDWMEHGINQVASGVNFAWNKAGDLASGAVNVVKDLSGRLFGGKDETHTYHVDTELGPNQEFHPEKELGVEQLDGTTIKYKDKDKTDVVHKAIEKQMHKQGTTTMEPIKK